MLSTNIQSAKTVFMPAKSSAYQKAAEEYIITGAEMPVNCFNCGVESPKKLHQKKIVEVFRRGCILYSLPIFSIYACVVLR